MKEIEFIPEWYAAGRRRQLGYRRQWLTIACLFAAMLSVRMVFSVSLSRTQAAIDNTADVRKTCQSITDIHADLSDRLNKAEWKSGVIKKLDPGVNLSAVLAELTSLGTDNMMLSKFEITAEKVKSTAASKSRVILSRTSAAGNGETLKAEELFKVVIAGLASDASYVNQLTSNLKNSSYFCRVLPGFWRNKEVGGRTVTEFEINCYLANYVQSEGNEL